MIMTTQTTINKNPKKCKGYEAVQTIAESFGFAVDPKIENGYMYPIRFVKDGCHVWQCIDRRTGVYWYQRADLLNNNYQNHVRYETKELAFLGIQCGYSELYAVGGLKDTCNFWLRIKGKDHCFNVDTLLYPNVEKTLQSIKHSVISVLDMDNLEHIKFKQYLLSL